jgi:hypothetical protein
MPEYGFICKEHGQFVKSMSMQEATWTYPCPECGADCFRDTGSLGHAGVKGKGGNSPDDQYTNTNQSEKETGKMYCLDCDPDDQVRVKDGDLRPVTGNKITSKRGNTEVSVWFATLAPGSTIEKEMQRKNTERMQGYPTRDSMDN